jgi:trimethylamine--corrinoid protein Co-methyltransferase
MLNMGGLLGSLMVFDFAKALIDHEVSLMLKQLKKGIRYAPEDLCLDLIAEVGPGGLFADQIHTLRKMRTTAYLPKVTQREMRESWKEQGEPEVGCLALTEARRIIAANNPAHFGSETDRMILARFPGLEKGRD